MLASDNEKSRNERVAIMAKAFNTGRQYNPPFGQVIGYALIRKNKPDEFGVTCNVAFYDLDRGINGVFYNIPYYEDEAAMQQAVLAAYDRGNYQSILHGDTYDDVKWAAEQFRKNEVKK